MKAYRIVTYVTDHEDIGIDEILYLMDNKHLYLMTGAISEIDIGEWDDDHPLNQMDTDVEKYFEERLHNDSQE